MNAIEVLKEKRHGDITDAASLLGVKPNNVVQILRRPNSKRHKAVLEAIGLIITNRKTLLKKNLHTSMHNNDIIHK